MLRLHISLTATLAGLLISTSSMVAQAGEPALWSTQPLLRPALPDVVDDSWCRTPTDRFILHHLEATGLKPNREAGRRQMIRRAYFDLIGLPPAPEEVDAFLEDRDPLAFGKIIDRLLANPHYGERWGRHWLDLARFAESHGYEQDYDRKHAWPYRDFVIEALNQDLPYDDFVRWQIAGDLLEPNNGSATLATGFLAAGTHATQITKNQAEKERYDELDDLAQTIGTSMLGLTIGCARCHDHKYDPIPAHDYYRLISSFTKTVRSNVDVVLEPEQHRKKLRSWQSAQDALLQARTRYEDRQLPTQLQAWLDRPDKHHLDDHWTILDQAKAHSTGKASLAKLEDGSFLASGANPAFDNYVFTVETQEVGITAFRLEALSHPSFVRGGPGRAVNGNIALSDLQITATPHSGGKSVKVELCDPRATFEQKGLPIRAAIDKDKKSAWAVDPQFGKDHAAVFQAVTPAGFPGGTTFSVRLAFANNKKHSIGRPRLSITTANSPISIDGPGIQQTARHALKSRNLSSLTAKEKAAVLRWFRTTDSDWLELDAKIRTHEKPKPKTVTALICGEGLKAVRLHTQGPDFYEETHHLDRGDLSRKVGVASPGFLTMLMRNGHDSQRWSEDCPPRVALANWITDTEHGAGHLLARVIVNRLWQHHFGVGIVATPSDFGHRGAAPTHPQLLDWLATELIAQDWRLKPIHALMMKSATYRVSTDIAPERSLQDPDNRLLWRRNRHRLEAEILRDAMLSVSGRLDPKMFGPGTLAQHSRRSIYFTVKRSKLIPMMMAFDAPNALQGCATRVNTTVAPQALVMMNNKTVRACAAAMAKRISPENNTDLQQAVQTGYRLALGRLPTDGEQADALAFLISQTSSYGRGTPGGQQKALADYCQVLLSLNEFIYLD